ncbi:endo-beta-N-acetylglucosaminidase [Streptomyces sp. NPDC089919]|uniref:endo-beta-N-acetylglucosaminidase n=1 Tax=Streptomyces sp. NPDC089919 TaxID=3155188 RepID=UPI0034186767
MLLAGAGTAAAFLGAAPAAAVPGAPDAPTLTPHAAYWYPGSVPDGTPAPGVEWRSLADWSPAADPDLPYRASTVPLAARFTPVPAHPGTTGAHIAALVSFGPTAGHPAQGFPGADRYAPTHWAYLDELVFWGGSAGEGVVLAPTAPVTDAAHRNGVRVLGTVFLPPAVYGGDLRWTRELVHRDAYGRFPLAGTLAEVAAAYGFDGWFVNAETDGGDPELAARMRGFLRALRAAGAARGLRVTWYDAMDRSGRVAWQGALNERNQDFFEDRRGTVADRMFLDFGWTGPKLAGSGRLARALGRGPYELWAGVDVESRGWDTPVDWEAVLPPGGAAVTSLGLYRPEWTLGRTADGSPAAFHAADDRFWTGRSLDPARPDPADPWRAPATAVADRATVTGLPFACAFNTGHGLRWYEDGEVRSAEPWNHLGLQDRLPGRRWEVAVPQGSERPEVSLDFEDAWRGGSSLLVAGSPSGPVAVGLHALRAALGPRPVLELTHRAADGPVEVAVGVAVAEPSGPGAPVPYVWFPAGRAAAADGWHTRRVPLTGLAGRTAHRLAVRLTGPGGAPVRWRLGALALCGDGPAAPPAAPARLRVTAAAGAGGGTAELRLRWDPAPGPVRHYELSRVRPDGRREFLGGSCGPALYVPALARAAGERAALLEVRAVDELYAASAPARTTFGW